MKNRVIQLLKWSEKYTKTDMLYLAKGGFWITLGQIISSFSALALAVAFANFVPPETYGTYKYILSIAAMFAIFSLPGMNTAMSRASARGHEGAIHAATKHCLLTSLIGSGIALLGSGYYFYNGNLELSLSFLIIAATLPLFDTFTLYLAHFAGKGRFDLKTKYHAISQILSVSILIGTLFITDNILLILLAYFLPLSLTRIVIYQHVLRKVEKTTGYEHQKEALSYGKHLTMMRVLGIVASQIDKILLWKFLGPAQLAIYAFAIAIPEQLKGPMKGLGELALPKFAAQTPEQIKQGLPALYRKLFLYALGLLSISILYVLAAPYIFQFIFPQYMESVIYSQVFSLSLVSVISVMLFSILESQKKVRAQYLVTTIQPILYIVFLGFLIPLYGVMGAIVAFLIGRFTITIMAIIITVRTFR